MGPPNISESKRDRKLKLKTPYDIVTYSPGVQKKFPLGYSDCASELSPVLSCLINYSINEGVVPQSWKQAIITPVPKTQPVSSVSDLRPISVTPVISRIVERLVIRDYLIPCIPSEHLTDQYAYKQTGSTTCAVINVTDTVGRMLENNRYVRCLLIDFSKAFDKVDHLLLLKKLHSYQLPGNILSWIVSFFTDRSQCTKIHGILSTIECINSSIVQGSVFGPNSFSIYVADLKALGNTNVLCKYADDTTLLVPEKFDVGIEDELRNVIKWSSANKLELNLVKTKEIVFRRLNVRLDILPVQLDCIERLECVKLLGVYIDSKLSFSEHVDHLLSVCNQRLYLLSQLRKQGLSDKCICIVYDAIVLSKILYALSAWGGYLNQTLKDRIDASFRKACKWKLTNIQYNFSDLLSDVDRKLFACSKAYGHCLHHMLPLHSNNSSQMTLRPRGHSYDVPRVNYDLTKRSFIMHVLYSHKSVLL